MSQPEKNVQLYPVLATVEIVPFAVNQKNLEKLFGSPQLVKQMRKAEWISVVRPGKPGREALFDYESTQVAYQRLRAGENPETNKCSVQEIQAKGPQ